MRTPLLEFNFSGAERLYNAGKNMIGDDWGCSVLMLRQLSGEKKEEDIAVAITTRSCAS